MKKLIISIVLFFNMNALVSAQKPDDYPVYKGTDLGLTYTPQYSTFKIWAPTAKEVTLRLYQKGLPEAHTSATGDANATRPNDPLLGSAKMTKGTDGTWSHTVKGDLKGQFYTFQITLPDGKSLTEVPDIYAKAVGVNGKRAQVVDLKKTNPKGWEADKSPAFGRKTNAIIYELHVRDASIAANSGIKNKGKFIGLAERGTTYTEGGKKISTGLDHIKELDVTHVQLLPIYDYFTVDESLIGDLNYKKYNWGYDPLNYNAPEGSYSTDPTDGATRIRELKTLIQAMHKAGLRVIMDVVYNHTMFGEESYFHQTVPNYFHRQTADGKWANASACGNETASDRPMMRKFMLESLQHWVKEYHIDGFRFDLMAIHDIETMNEISKSLHKIKPDILLLGEGWTAGDSPLPENRRSLKKYAYRLDKIAAFGDDLRDALKGSVFEHKDNGFVSGKKGVEESIKFGVVAATQHPQVDYSKVNYSKERWAGQPYQCINYPECHDNHTLWDRLLNSNPNDSEADRIKMHKLAQTIVLTAQGIPFLHAGTEFLRTKKGVENSYNSPDDVNEIDWSRKMKYLSVNDYFRKIIALRKNHPAFRMATTAQIQRNLKFLPVPAGEGVVAYTLNGRAVGDKWQRIVVLYNGNKTAAKVKIPRGAWKVVLDGEKVSARGLKAAKGGNYNVPPISAVILAEF